MRLPNQHEQNPQPHGITSRPGLLIGPALHRTAGTAVLLLVLLLSAASTSAQQRAFALRAASELELLAQHDDCYEEEELELGQELTAQRTHNTTEEPASTEQSAEAARAENDLWARTRDLLGSPTTLQRATSGALLFATDTAGLYYEAPALEQTVTVEVYGLIARTRVEQRFSNPTEAWLEGIYVFPLPERAAVDELRMLVGAREILGVIQEKEEAKRTYEVAKASGRKASLIEQERPNIFTNSVANIGPGEEIVVTIEYQEDLRYDDGHISLRFPLVVAPRYNPGTTTVTGFSGSGWGLNTDQVPDAQRITPPVVLTAADFGGSAGDTEIGFADLRSREPEQPLHPTQLTVFIDHSLVLDGIESPSHSIVVTDTPQAYVVELEPGTVEANRDFVLEWWPDQRSAPQAALYTQDHGEHTFAHLMVVPPTDPHASSLRTQQRELVFVIDTSGSMGGTSIEQAKAALLLALDRLQPHDTFDVIEFNSGARALFSAPQTANQRTVDQARRFVRGLRANGGTNILAALELALVNTPFTPHGVTTGEPAVRQVVFVTDGSVGNEDELFRAIEQRLADRRLFTVGIGSAPNNHFMSRAAQFGRGTFTNISDLGEVERQMGGLFRKLESPALIDLEVSWEGWSPEAVASIEAWPQRLPDLYAGEPIVLNARLPRLEGGSGELVVRGLRDGLPWEARLPVERGGERSGVDRLWARQKIRSLIDEKTRGALEELIRPQVVALGLAHHLVTQYTSLVAVDTSPSRPAGETLTSKPIPVRLPSGWSAETTFGVAGPSLPAGGTASTLFLLLGLALSGAGFALLRARTPSA